MRKFKINGILTTPFNLKISGLDLDLREWILVLIGQLQLAATNENAQLISPFYF